jgi:hypothetical protein
VARWASLGRTALTVAKAAFTGAVAETVEGTALLLGALAMN